MSHHAIVLVVEQRRARVWADRWFGARVLGSMAGGARDVVERIDGSMARAGAIEDAEAGWLADLDRQRLLWFGDAGTSYIGERVAERMSARQEDWRKRGLEEIERLEELTRGRGAMPEVRARLIHNRGIMRLRMKLPKLAERDLAKARELGFRAPRPSRLRGSWMIVKMAFLAMTGLLD